MTRLIYATRYTIWAWRDLLKVKPEELGNPVMIVIGYSLMFIMVLVVTLPMFVARICDYKKGDEDTKFSLQR